MECCNTLLAVKWTIKKQVLLCNLVPMVLVVDRKGDELVYKAVNGGFDAALRRHPEIEHVGCEVAPKISPRCPILVSSDSLPKKQHKFWIHGLLGFI